MTDTKCNNCQKEFHTKVRLKRHLQNKTKCKSNNPVNFIEILQAQIQSNSLNIETMALLKSILEDAIAKQEELDLINKKIIKCGDCGTTFAHRQSLNNHKKLNRCKATKGLPNKDDDVIKSNDDFITSNVTATINNTIHTTIDNSINNHINNNISNNIISNNINITIAPNFLINVNPFGLESIEHISVIDFKNIFKSTDAIMDKLCYHIFNRHIPNISFFKNNLNKQIISYLNKNMEIKLIDESVFVGKIKDFLEDLCIQLFYNFKDQLTVDELVKYMRNLVEFQNITTSDYENKITKNSKSTISRLMDYAFRNKDIKNAIDNLIKHLKTNIELKNQLIKKNNEEDRKRGRIANEYYLEQREIERLEENDKNNDKLLCHLRKKAETKNIEATKVTSKKILEQNLESINFANDEE